MKIIEFFFQCGSLLLVAKHEEKSFRAQDLQGVTYKIIELNSRHLCDF